ncbi:MAG: HPr family phosphocarrier protein [Eubacteriales bacterium]|nr:HPr family phosphocarrier protein [Eubacteriales bacterium]
MKRISYTIHNKVGLHARPASLFIKKANEFDSDISIELGEKKIDGKSILSIMTLGAGQGAVIEITADGKDEDDALRELVTTLDSFED